MSEREEEPDLNELDDSELEREKKRDSVRERREARKQRRARARQELAQAWIDSGTLVLASLASLGVVAVGLIQGNSDMVRYGIFGFGGVGGGVLLRQVRRKDPK
jgi:hypothetical protein